MTMGETGPRLVFCHGLFGQGKNWTTIAKSFAADHRVVLVDMPEHGRSPWSDHFSYLEAADRVADLLRSGGEDPVALVGHSMGGKIAMALALRHPALVERLCVVDISPVDYHGTSDFTAYVAAMRGLDLAAITTRSDADAALAVADDTVRGFLLQNLRREGDSWRWQMNLDVLGDSLDVIAGWPDELARSSYDGPVLWVAGAESGYVKEEYAAAMAALFPHVRRVNVKNAGHWVHAAQPAVFSEVLRRFLA